MRSKKDAKGAQYTELAPDFSTERLVWRGVELAYHCFSAVVGTTGVVPTTASASTPTVVLLHATGFPVGAYFPLLRRFAAHGYRAIGLDFIGHGASAAQRPESWDDFGDQAHALIQALATQEIYLMGHSLGGAAALLAAARDSGPIRALALLDPTVFSPLVSFVLPALPHPLAQAAERRRRIFANRALVERSYRLSPTFRNWDEDCFQSYLAFALEAHDEKQWRLRLDPQLEAQIFRSFHRGQWRKHRQVRQPLLALLAERSSVCPPRSARRLASQNKISRWATVDGGSHLFPFERPRQTVDAVLDFFQKIREG